MVILKKNDWLIASPYWSITLSCEQEVRILKLNSIRDFLNFEESWRIRFSIVRARYFVKRKCTSVSFGELVLLALLYLTSFEETYLSLKWKQLLTLTYQIQVLRSAVELYVQFLRSDVGANHVRMHKFYLHATPMDGFQQGLVPCVKRLT